MPTTAIASRATHFTEPPPVGTDNSYYEDGGEIMSDTLACQISSLDLIPSSGSIILCVDRRTL